MSYRIGLLLPRSTDYPSMGYDILHALKARLRADLQMDVEVLTENIGFGEDHALNFAKAEKLLLSDGADLLVAYANATNAAALYPLADALRKPFLFLDSGMQFAEGLSPYAYHISLQGIHACRIAGQMAGSGSRKVLMATSFYDGGYRGPWGYDRGLSEEGGSVCANFVSGYRTADFTIDPYIGQLRESGATSVAACFSSYLAELFFKALNEKKTEALTLPFYCSPFMAEEELLQKCEFPGGSFHTVVPWAGSLENSEQESFKNAVERDRKATLFHLLGWEAGIAASQALRNGAASLEGFSYDSPRGRVTIHPSTHFSYAPLYAGNIEADEKNKCTLRISNTIPVDADSHERIMSDRPTEEVSGWKNNYLCI